MFLTTLLILSKKGLLICISDPHQGLLHNLYPYITQIIRNLAEKSQCFSVSKEQSRMWDRTPPAREIG